MAPEPPGPRDPREQPSHFMWGGRFRSQPAASFDALNRSLPVDYRLWPYDIRASKAWVRALAKAGILSSDEENRLIGGLDRVAARLAEGAGEGAADEDVHTLVERLLYEEVGELAGKLHTGRSRNDQVATDLRLWALDAAAAIDQELKLLGLALLKRAREGIDWLLPGYTHGQRAQPVRWGFVLAAHAWPLVRDRKRLAECARRIAELPLGSGALAGSGIEVDRVLLKETLGFKSISPNALDATGNRDFVAELLFVVALATTHVSRLAGELMTYSTAEFGFIRLADEFSTGSSLMPQKRNPDVLELARAKAARTLGDLVGLLSALKGLPAGYSKDLQEDKAFLFDAVDTLLVTLPAVRGAVETMVPVPERMSAALDRAMLATDLADELVRRGVPFREAHRLVGLLVREAEERGVDLVAVPQDRAAAIHPLMPQILGRLGSFEDSVERRATAGGSSRAAVEAQLESLQHELAAPSPPLP
ncbi:Argininosuccinate lyase [bacterium HR33]|nr:Argininosuccinate lyase [bacterium HR33]